MNKKPASLYIGVIVIFVLTAAVTYYAGSLSGRWGTFRGLEEARAALKALPKEIGDWHVVPEDPNDPDKEREMHKTAVSMLRIQDSYLMRTYKNAATQAVVHLTFMIGPTGKITVHTPEVCFGGKAFEKDANRTRVQINVPLSTGEVVDSFWRVNFTGRSLDTNSRISFYYAVSPGETWNAVDVPRSTYQTYRYVYKLQAEAYAGVHEDGDSVKKFLEDCLPTIHEHMRQCY